MAQSNGTPVVLLLLEDCDVPPHLKRAYLVDFSHLQNATGLDQLQQYRSAMQSLVSTLDKLYPVRVYLQDLTNTNDMAREAAARNLGDLGDPSATEALIKLLVDPDVDVRFVTAESLGKLRSQSALRPLIRVLGNDDDPDVRAAAATSLGQLGLSEAIPPLMEQLTHDDRFVRASAAEALGNLRANAAVRPLIHMMRNDPISDVRHAAACALCIVGGPTAERALIRAGINCAELT